MEIAFSGGFLLWVPQIPRNKSVVTLNCGLFFETVAGVSKPYPLYRAIGNLLCMKKIIHRTVWMERMKVSLVIFNVQFIFLLINETYTVDFSIHALEAFLCAEISNYHYQM